MSIRVRETVEKKQQKLEKNNNFELYSLKSCKKITRNIQKNFEEIIKSLRKCLTL